MGSRASKSRLVHPRDPYRRIVADNWVKAIRSQKSLGEDPSLVVLAMIDAAAEVLSTQVGNVETAMELYRQADDYAVRPPKEIA